MKLALMDIDGCLSSCDHRIDHLLKDGDYEKYLSLSHLDTPIPQGVYFYRLLFEDPNVLPVFITARGEDQREMTVSQIQKFVFPHLVDGKDFELWMRPVGDKRHDYDLKIWHLESRNLTPENIFIAFDDRQVICEAYRKFGIVAYQTATGY